MSTRVPSAAAAAKQANALLISDAETAAKVAEIARRERIKAWSDYIGFGLAKVSGLATTAYSGYDLLFHGASLAHPGSIAAAAGGGLALVFGHKIPALIKKLTL